MGDDLQLLDQQPAASAQPIKPPVPRRLPLSPSEKQMIREGAARGESASEIARKLDDRPVRTVRDAMRAMGLAKPMKPPSVESLPANGSTPKPKRAKPSQPFSEADRIRVENLVRSGLSAAQIAERLNRGLPQISRLVKELGGEARQRWHVGFDGALSGGIEAIFSAAQRAGWR
jgi:hypothetical protein